MGNIDFTIEDDKAFDPTEKRSDDEALSLLDRMVQAAAEKQREIAQLKQMYEQAMASVIEPRKRAIERAKGWYDQLALTLYHQSKVKTLPLPCGTKAKVSSVSERLKLVDAAAVPDEFMQQPDPPPKKPDIPKAQAAFKNDGEIPDGFKVEQAHLSVSVNLEHVRLPETESLADEIIRLNAKVEALEEKNNKAEMA